MKTFGLKSLYVQLFVIVLLVCFLVFAPKTWGMRQAMIIPFSLMVGQLVYAPVIRLSGNRLRIFTFTPFQRNINIKFPEVHKIIVEVNSIVRFIVHKKDGTVVSAICSRYTYDMKPLYKELLNRGVAVESRGAGTIDWVKE